MSQPDSWKQEQIDRMYDRYSEKFPEVKSITAAQLQQWQSSQKIILVDVRTPKEREVSIFLTLLLLKNSSKFREFTPPSRSLSPIIR
ncbi:MAG: hypothetical protein HC847_29890 [Hydrococcus sp. RU_2_2]|nr:hypothetical protein [Hydrococcus sp. RU_2_2]